MRQRKAEGAPINLIVAAAIALVIMIVMIMIFTGNIGKWRRGTENCESKRGACVSNEDADGNFRPDDCQNDYEVVMPYNCTDSSKVCCLRM